jgi:threonine aldolase
MADAEVGDDVFGDDPTIQALEERFRALLGKEAAVFVPSGTMGNQIALRVLAPPGSEVVVEAHSHIMNLEAGAAAALSGITLRPVPGERGALRVEDVEAAIRGGDAHLAPTRAVSVENTHNRAGGAVIPLPRVRALSDLARARGLAFHLDGARIWNAAEACGVSPAVLAAPADTVTACFSKGLGAPIGSALAGPRELVHRARLERKRFGGGMRQVGILGAAALYALEHNLPRIGEDHRKAKRFAEGIARIPGLAFPFGEVETNIVIFDVGTTGRSAAEWAAAAREAGVLVNAVAPTRIRAVFHLDVPPEAVDPAVEVLSRIALASSNR